MLRNYVYLRVEQNTLWYYPYSFNQINIGIGPIKTLPHTLKKKKKKLKYPDRYSRRCKYQKSNNINSVASFQFLKRRGGGTKDFFFFNGSFNSTYRLHLAQYNIHFISFCYHRLEPPDILYIFFSLRATKFIVLYINK